MPAACPCCFDLTLGKTFPIAWLKDSRPGNLRTIVVPDHTGPSDHKTGSFGSLFLSDKLKTLRKAQSCPEPLPIYILSSPICCGVWNIIGHLQIKTFPCIQHRKLTSALFSGRSELCLNASARFCSLLFLSFRRWHNPINLETLVGHRWAPIFDT